MTFRRTCLLFLVLFAATTIYAQSSADLSVTKSGPALAGPNTDVTYTVTVTNAGPDAAGNATLTDTIPDDMTFVSATQDNGPAFDCTPLPSVGGIGTITCTLASFPASTSAQFTFVFHIDPDVNPGTPFVNMASISSGTPDPNGDDNSDSTTTTTPAADLILAKSGPATANPGDNVAYVVTVTNLGPQDAAGVEINDFMPNGMDYVSAVQDSGPSGSCSFDSQALPNGVVTCSIATLPAGVSAQFTITFQINNEAGPGEFFTNTSTVTTSTGDPNEENNSAFATTSTPPPPTADLTLQKSGPTAAGPGTDIVYTLTLTNAGPDAAANVTLNDTLPGTLTFVSLGQSGTSLSCTTPAVGAGGTVMCTAGTYPSGATTTLTLTVHVPGDTPSGTVFVNEATITSDSDPNSENDVATISTTISAVDVSIVKSGPPTGIAGQTLTYTLTVNNAGPETAASVVFIDELPPGTTFNSLTQNTGPTFDCLTGGTITCSIQLLTSGTTATFTLVVNTLPSAAGTVTNTANITTESFDTDANDNSSSVMTTLAAQADLGVTKNGPASITAGNNMTYTITAANAGPSDAANVSLTDTLPPGTSFVSLTQNTGPAFSCTTGPSITCTRATFTAGSSASFTLVVAVASSATGTISNTAQIGSSTTDTNNTNDSNTTNATVLTSADVSVVKSGPPFVAAGTNVTYTIVVANAGPSDAANLSLSDTLPAGTTFVSETQNTGPTFNCTTGAIIVCTIATLPAGASANFTFVASVPPGATGTLTNTAIVSSTTSDPNGLNNSSTTNATIAINADVSVTKSGPATALANTNITYTVVVANAGPSTANNVTLTDNLPAGTTFVSANQTGQPFNCTTPAVGAPGTITCTIASLAPATSTTFTFVFAIAPTASGTLDNTANVTSPTLDPNPNNNTSTASTGLNPGATDLSITKTASATAAGFGAPVTYTITVTNNGPATAFGTTVTDILPAGATFVSATPSQGSCTGTTTVVCTLGTLAPAASATIQLRVNLPTTPGTVTNTATVSAANAETSPGDNTSSAAIVVSAEIPSLSEWGLILLALGLAVAALKLRMT